MLAVTRLRFGADDEPTAGLRGLVAALADRPGFVRAAIARSLDDRQLWVLTTEWSAVGDYRRALSAYDVKLAFAPLMQHVLDEPSAFEVVAESGADPASAAE